MRLTEFVWPQFAKQVFGGGVSRPTPLSLTVISAACQTCTHWTCHFSFITCSWCRYSNSCCWCCIMR